MTLEILAISTVCLSCFSIFVRTIVSPYYRGWSIVSGIVLAVSLSLALRSPFWAAFIGTSLWVVSILLPLFGFARMNRLIERQRYGDARKLAVALRWLHPADGWLEQPELLQTLEIGQQGRIAEALERLEAYGKDRTPFLRHAIALLYAMGACWPELCCWVRDRVPDRLLAKEPNLLSYYLRALGETGELNELVWQVKRFWSVLEQTGNPLLLDGVRLCTLAFCGQREPVVYLFEHSLTRYDPKIREFWYLTALMAAGDDKIARSALETLADPQDPILSKAIAWRLSHPPAIADLVLSHASRKLLLHLSWDYKQDLRYERALVLIPQKAYATYLLIAINSLVFALELYWGGSENLETLYQLGALAPDEVWNGQWWRLINANFLHFDWVHLLTNMLGLYFLGPFVELSLGRIRYLLAYLGSGMGTMFAFSFIALQFGNSQQLLVGASAAIMGLIGVTAVLLTKGWLLNKSRVARSRLRFIAAILIGQVIFDFIVPQVSFFAHTSGFMLGAIAGVLLSFNWRFKSRV